MRAGGQYDERVSGSVLAELEAPLAEAVSGVGGDGAAVRLERPADASHGDYATGVAMALAKPLRSAPRDIAGQIVERLDSPWIDSAEIAGPGFVNLRVAAAWYRHVVDRVLDEGAEYGAGAVQSPQRIQVEFVSGNPTGPVTVATARNAAYGDSLARLFAFAGHQVSREYYFNDAGRQIDLFGASLQARARGEETERFRPRRMPERMLLGLPLEPPAEGLEAIRFILRRLSAALADQLQARGQAAGLARLVVTHDLAFARRGTPETLRFEQRFPEPTADPEAIERLLVARLEKQPPPAAVARLELELGLVEAAAGTQLPLFVPQAARDARLAWQLARLAIAFGADKVRRVELADPEAPLPETRWRWAPVAGAEVTGEEPWEGSR